MKAIATISLLAFIQFFASAQTINPYFYTQGTLLKDPCGNTFNIKGVNYAPYNWGSDANELVLNQIAKTGSNSVRMVWYANHPNTVVRANYNAQNMGKAIDTCAKYGMLPIVELHDQTCQNSPTALIALSNYFLQADVKAVLQARQNKLIINIANEVLYAEWDSNPATAPTTFKNTYNTIVSNLRAAGYVCPIMIDGPDCGTNSDVLAAVGANIIAADTKHNIIFSVHTYWYSYANNTPATMQQKLQTIINANIPFVLGEIANQQDETGANCAYTLNYQALLNICQTLGVNWMPWGWYRDVCPDRQMTTTGNYANLTPYGNDLVNNTVYGIKNKAVKSPYLLNNANCIVATDKIDSDFGIKILNLEDAWQFISAHNAPLQLRIYSITGQLLTTQTLPENSNVLIPKPEARGVYIVSFVGNDGHIQTKKLKH